MRKRTTPGLGRFAEPASVILRDERSSLNVRRLTAQYAENGDLVIEGQDVGNSVNTALGYREYEWNWTIREADIPKLKSALKAKTSLLAALKCRFCDENAILIEGFLNDHSIPFDFWNRLGD